MTKFDKMMVKIDVLGLLYDFRNHNTKFDVKLLY
jgi:hypothetical protein